jgi:broad specificity phosphatase PhoE
MKKQDDETRIRILLLRHGETDWNKIHRSQGSSDVPRTQGGGDRAHSTCRDRLKKKISISLTIPIRS